MLFWIFVIGMVVFFILGVVFDDLMELFVGLFAMFGMVTLIMLVVIIINNVGINGQIAKMNTRHDSLVYQYENDIYDNDNDLGKRDLIVDIQEWNEDLASKQKNQDDFWIGIFVPNIYDQFEFIELK